MATSGSTIVAVTSYDTLKFSWVQVGQSTVNNYTTINWSLQLVSTSAGQIISSAVKSWSVTVNGTAYSGTNSVAIGNNETKTLASGQTVITHNTDGSKSFSYSFSQEFGITFAGASVGTKTGSGTGTLNTIPRATTPTFHTSSIDLDGTVTIYTSRASDTFTHDLSYSFAGSDYVSIATGVESYLYWKVPLDLANSMPNTTSGTLTLKCVTKNGNTVIGTKTALLTVKVPTNITPTINRVTHEEAATGTAIESIGAYVQSKSKVLINIYAAGSYGSTIKSYSTVIEGKTYTGSSFTTDVISGSGSVYVKVTVTDSRDRTVTTNDPITVLAYAPPKITAFQVARYTSAGVGDPNGTYAGIQLAYSVSSLNSKNTAKAQVQYKKSTDTTWSTLLTQTQLSLNTTLKPTGTTFSTDYQWDFRLSLTDAFTSATPTTYTTIIPSGAVILDIKADGKGIAFFKTSTKDGVDIDGALPNSPISLTTNANLNSLTTPGFYVIPTTAISATVTNKPYTDTATASIKVERTGDGQLRQILQKSTKDDGVIYERAYTSASWGSWSIMYAGAGKVLWSGNYLMNASQTVTFSEPLSSQQNGIVLIFSRYATTGEQNYAYSPHYIPKMVFTATGLTSVNLNLVMATTKFDYVAGKTLTLTDTGISGHADNSATGTASISGITYYNDKFALRCVIGV